MIPHDLATHLLDVISWHRTWLAVKDFGTYGTAPVLDTQGQMTFVNCRLVRFEVRIAKSGYRRFQTVSLTEPAIERAIRRLSMQSDFKQRISERQLTYRDINRLVLLASDDTIDLELESYT